MTLVRRGCRCVKDSCDRFSVPGDVDNGAVGEIFFFSPDELLVGSHGWTTAKEFACVGWGLGVWTMEGLIPVAGAWPPVARVGVDSVHVVRAFDRRHAAEMRGAREDLF